MAKRSIKVAVIGVNATGATDVWTTTIKATEKEIEEGDVLDKALALAQDDDFDGKFAVDADDMPGFLARLNSEFSVGLRTAATNVVNNWEKGDLAGAVRELAAALKTTG